jgi:hypothetical protein
MDGKRLMANWRQINAKDKMTKRERVEATLNFEETDRVCIEDILQNEGMIEYFSGEKMKPPEFKDHNYRITAKAIRACFDLYRCLLVPNGNFTETWDNGFVVRWTDYTMWIVERPWNDRKGLIEWVKKTTEEAYDWKPDEEWGPWGKTTFKDGYRGVWDWRQKYLGDTVQIFDSGVGTDIYDAIGIEDFMLLYADEPDLVSGLIEAINLHEVKKIRYVADRDLSPVALVYTDLAYRTGTIFSPSFLRKEFFPRLKRLCDTWHEFDIKCIYHSDGDYSEVLDDFVKAGVDGLNPLDPLSGWDLVSIKEKYPHLIIMGNIDVSQLLPYGSAEDVKDAVKKLIDDIYPRGGLILSSSSELIPNVGRNAENGIIMNLFAKEYSRGNPFRPREIDEIEIEL